MLFKAMGQRHSVAAGFLSVLLIGAGYAGSREVSNRIEVAPTVRVEVESKMDCEDGSGLRETTVRPAAERAT